MATRRRVFRVAERVQAVVATELLRLSDPRVYLVTVTSVTVSPDLRHAKVFFMVTGGEERREDAAEGLASAAGHLRTSIAKSLGVRSAPELRFYYDDTLDARDEIEALLARAK